MILYSLPNNCNTSLLDYDSNGPANHTPGVYIFVQSSCDFSTWPRDLLSTNCVFISLWCKQRLGVLLIVTCSLEHPGEVIQRIKYPEQKSWWTNRHVNESAMDRLHRKVPSRKNMGEMMKTLS